MLIGCPTEIKPQEYRVGLTPSAASEAIHRGHKVLIQSGAGLARASPMPIIWPPGPRSPPMPKPSLAAPI